MTYLCVRGFGTAKRRMFNDPEEAWAWCLAEAMTGPAVGELGGSLCVISGSHVIFDTLLEQRLDLAELRRALGLADA